MPKLFTSLSWTPTFEWYVVKCGSKNGWGMIIKEDVLQTMITILNLVVYIFLFFYCFGGGGFHSNDE